jgi:L-2-hydroxyglutarate oxidase
VKKTFDYIIIGAGIVGLTIAYELCLRHKKSSIAILEKEPYIGKHASGRNSGVLHSGIYYQSDTLKAKVCSEGARRMKDFAKNHNIQCQSSGKIIVATSDEDLNVIDQLLKNAKENGISAKRLNEEAVHKIEPYAGVYKEGIYCEDTAVIDSKAVLNKLDQLLKDFGVQIILNASVIEIDKNSNSIFTTAGLFNYGYLFNCAGSYADKIAKFYGLCSDYELLPFKGIYYKLKSDRAYLVKSNIYPVPNIKQPFLGVHLTRVVSGEIYVGPTAMPALGRENYGFFKGAHLGESLRIGLQISKMYLSNQQNFRQLVWDEMGKYRKKNFFESVKKLVPKLHIDDLLISDKVGIRPQLTNIKKKQLEMDFVVEKSDNSIHILNAISPAFTSSLAFAKHVVDQINLL